MKKRVTHVDNRIFESFLDKDSWTPFAGNGVTGYDCDGLLKQALWASPEEMESLFWARCYIMPFDQTSFMFFEESLCNGRLGNHFALEEV